MPIRIVCPNCKKIAQVPDAAAGKTAKCKCGASFVVTGEGAEAKLTPSADSHPTQSDTLDESRGSQGNFDPEIKNIVLFAVSSVSIMLFLALWFFFGYKVILLILVLAATAGGIWFRVSRSNGSEANGRIADQTIGKSVSASDEPKFCGGCGQSWNSGNKFCPNCGYDPITSMVMPNSDPFPVVQNQVNSANATNTAPSGSLRCDSCGGPIVQDLAKCQYCGNATVVKFSGTRIGELMQMYIHSEMWEDVATTARKVLEEHPQNAIAWAARGLAALKNDWDINTCISCFSTVEKFAGKDGMVSDMKKMAATTLMNDAREPVGTFMDCMKGFNVSQFDAVSKLYWNIYASATAAMRLSPAFAAEVGTMLDRIDLPWKSLGGTIGSRVEMNKSRVPSVRKGLIRYAYLESLLVPTLLIVGLVGALVHCAESRGGFGPASIGSTNFGVTFFSAGLILSAVVVLGFLLTNRMRRIDIPVGTFVLSATALIVPLFGASLETTVIATCIAVPLSYIAVWAAMEGVRCSHCYGCKAGIQLSVIYAEQSGYANEIRSLTHYNRSGDYIGYTDYAQTVPVVAQGKQINYVCKYCHSHFSKLNTSVSRV